MQIGVLALQGAFIEHEQMLSTLAVSSFEIRQEKDFEKSFDGLIIPGGETQCRESRCVSLICLAK